MIREIVARGCQAAGLPYKEAGYLAIRRGKYFALQSFAEPYALSGSWVDILDPRLSVRENVTIPSGGRCLMTDVSRLLAEKKPRILAASDRIEASLEQEKLTSLFLTGPLGTKGAVRVSSAGRTPEFILVTNTKGEPVPNTGNASPDSLLITYDSLPDGVIIKITWSLDVL